MFKYIKFTKVKDEFTAHLFRGGDEDIKVNYFDVDVVSIQGDDEDKLNELIASQNPAINCIEITKDKFKELVTNSAQINRIRDVVKERIASKYSTEDEIAMMKRDEFDNKKIAYLAYVEECKQVGVKLKEEFGIFQDEDIIPTSITPRQLRMQLKNEGLRETVENMIKESTDYELKDWWEYSLVFARSHSILESFASSLIYQMIKWMKCLWQLVSCRYETFTFKFIVYNLYIC